MPDATGEPRTEAARAVFDETHGASLGGWVEMPDDDARALYVAIEAQAWNAALAAVEEVLRTFMGVWPGIDRDAEDHVLAAIAHLRQGEPT